MNARLSQETPSKRLTTLVYLCDNKLGRCGNLMLIKSVSDIIYNLERSRDSDVMYVRVECAAFRGLYEVSKCNEVVYLSSICLPQCVPSSIISHHVML